jgi:hypothetical protein
MGNVQREIGENMLAQTLRQCADSEALEGAPVEKQLSWILERDGLVKTALPDLELTRKLIPGRPSETGGDQVPSLAM